MGDRAKAIATIRFSRNTHVEWAAYMRGHNDTVGCNCGKAHPDVNNLGDAAYHENCIAEYDNVLAVLTEGKAEVKPEDWLRARAAELRKP